MTKLEQSELEIMHLLGITKLPNVSKSEWLKAVVLVLKNDTTTNYAIAKCVDGKVSIVKDYGTISQICQILEVRPYETPNKSKKQ